MLDLLFKNLEFDIFRLTAEKNGEECCVKSLLCIKLIVFDGAFYLIKFSFYFVKKKLAYCPYLRLASI